MRSRTSFSSRLQRYASFVAVAIACLTGLGNATQVQAQRYALTSDAVIHRAGLMVEWSSQAPVGPSDRLIDWELFVDENQATTTFEVRAGSQREVISQFDRNPRGEVYGVDGAEAQAKDRRDYLTASLTARGKKDVPVSVTKYQRPKATLFMMTDSGEVSSVDANTGKTLWLSRVGSGTGRGIGLGVHTDYIAAVRGSVLHVLENSTGKELWSKPCKYAVGSSPAVTDDYVMVPLTDGRLELFPIESQGLGSYALMALGEGTAQPLVTAASISWPTSRGELNVMLRNGDGHSISYRLRSDAAIVSSATYHDGTLFVGSLDGFLYAINEARGSTRWAISLGVGISESPVPLGEHVFAISDDRKLYKVVAKTGELAAGWETPLDNVEHFIGAGEKDLYVLDNAGNLVVIDQNSRAIVNRVGVGQIDLLLNNYLTDRLYIASHSGVIQCLREIGSVRPYFHGEDPATEKMEGAADMEMSDETPMPENANPFAGDENPFGGGENPFGETKDPFGGDDESEEESQDLPPPAEEDPFGGTEDPFG